MSKAKHTPEKREPTPVPWSVSDISHGPARIIECPKRHLIAQTLGENDEANAEFIVRACNSHNDLLTVCEELLCRLPCMPDNHDGNRAIKKAKAAIAKAEVA